MQFNRVNNKEHLLPMVVSSGLIQCMCMHCSFGLGHVGSLHSVSIYSEFCFA